MPVSNNGGANAVSVAEHTMLLILAVLKRLRRHHDKWWRASGAWATSPRTALRAEGKTLGIVGLGTIGKKVARRAHGFGCR